MTLRQDLYIRQGETFSHVYTHLSGGSAVDLAGYSAKASIRKAFGTSLEQYAYLSTGADADGGSISLGGANGQATLSMTATETRDLIASASFIELLRGEASEYTEPYVTLFYDLILVDGSGAATRAIEGRCVVSRGVSE